MANLKDKLSQFNEVVIYTQASDYFNALNEKLNEAVGSRLDVKKSYLSKYEVVDDLRTLLREDFRTQKPEGVSIPDEDFEIITPLLDASVSIINIAKESESDYNKLESFLNNLATNVKGAFDPPIGQPFSAEGATVYPIPQTTELDPRRYGRVLQFESFTKSQKDWLIDNCLLYGFTLYEDYGLYYIGFKQIQTQAQSSGIASLINKFQQTPIPAGEINLSVSAVTNAKDPVVGNLDIATLSAPAYNNDNQPFSQLAYVPGGQLLPPETATAVMRLISAAKLDGLELTVNSGFRPAVDGGQIITWTTVSGKSGKLTTQESLRRDSKRWVKSNKYYKQFVDPAGTAGTDKRESGTTGKFGYKEGKEAFIYYASSAGYNAATAPPGHSNHGSGIAADFNTGGRKNFSPLKEQNYIWLAKNAHKYGFVRTVSSEEWHFEYRPDVSAQGPYAIVKPGSGGKLVNNGWYADLGLNNLTA
jgi:LAS superfamily LD-carboxypeptidase LdcB